MKISTLLSFASFVLLHQGVHGGTSYKVYPNASYNLSKFDCEYDDKKVSYISSSIQYNEARYKEACNYDDACIGFVFRTINHLGSGFGTLIFSKEDKKSLENCLTPRNSDYQVFEKAGGGAHGDPHFLTFKGEHFEYHGQCDAVLAKDASFSDGMGLHVQIRTKLVRYWSYIESAAIMIGNDILEITGNPDPELSKADSHHWFNFEPNGLLEDMAGLFAVTVRAPSPAKRVYEIDLSSKYAGHSIVISTYKEFVSVDFKTTSAAAYGNLVGLLGDYKTGKTFARDGTTILNDFSELGNEWQVMPEEPKLFHELHQPQFPNKCILPEDPRGERRRRLDESSIAEEEAEKACAGLTNADDRKDCVYDIIATQDLGMVGAY